MTPFFGGPRRYPRILDIWGLPILISLVISIIKIYDNRSSKQRKRMRRRKLRRKTKRDLKIDTDSVLYPHIDKP
jgi:hypothetical protein